MLNFFSHYKRKIHVLLSCRLNFSLMLLSTPELAGRSSQSCPRTVALHTWQALQTLMACVFNCCATLLVCHAHLSDAYPSACCFMYIFYTRNSSTLSSLHYNSHKWIFGGKSKSSRRLLIDIIQCLVVPDVYTSG